MTHPKTILHIEDNFENRILVRRLLESDGYRVLEAGSSDEALIILQTNVPDMILMDINMPGTDGYTLTAKIKTMDHLSRIPIIAITANVMKGDRERTLRAGCDDYIEKPIDIDRFLEQIARMLSFGND